MGVNNMNEDMMNMQPIPQEQQQSMQMINRQDLARLKEIEKIYNIQMKTMGRQQPVQPMFQNAPLITQNQPIPQQPQEQPTFPTQPTLPSQENVITNVITSPQPNYQQQPYIHPAFAKRQQMQQQPRPEYDEIEMKIKNYLEKQKYGKRSRFNLPFMKKKIPKHKAMDKFDSWLKEKCENDCYVCDKCEEKLRTIINEGWIWIEKLNSN
jgi:hypothetical protein